MASTSIRINLFSTANQTKAHVARIPLAQDHPKSQQFVVLQLEQEAIDRCLEILEWRRRTFLPVVKPLHFALTHPSPLSPLHPHNIPHRSPSHFQKTFSKAVSPERRKNEEVEEDVSGAICEVMVTMEGIEHVLCDIKLLPFPQVLYLLKQMMIGYEVLVDIFGIFEPLDSMVAVNSSQHWKLWVNSNFTLNAIPAPNLSEKEFIYKLILIAQSHCLETTLSKRFFMEVKEITYSQECSFVKVLQKTKDFAAANKVYTASTVMLPREEKDETRTLRKQKGLHRIEQMKCSLIEGKFVPKQPWSYCTEANDPSLCSIDTSPIRKTESAKNNQEQHFGIQGNILAPAWKTQDQLGEFLTPREREKNNPNAGQLYSPQMFGLTQSSPVRPRATVSPLLNFTTANSIIERRRRSQKVKCNNQEGLSEQKALVQCHLMRHPGVKNFQQTIKNEEEQAREDLINSFNKSSSTRLKESQAEQQPVTYKNLKRNDFQIYCKPRNNQSGFVHITLPTNHRGDSKALSISYEFKTNNGQHSQEQQGSDPPVSRQWKNTISGLFSDTATIRQLKTSIKIKTPHDKNQERKYSSDVYLEVLSKMGRDATDSFDEEEDGEMADLRLTEQSFLFKNGQLCRDDQEEEVLRRPACTRNNIPNIIINGPLGQKGGVSN